MKIAKSAYSKDEAHKGNRKVKPILPLVPEDDDLEQGDATKVATFKLRTVPSDANSATYSFAIQIMDGTRSVRQAINWYNRTTKLFRGLDIANVKAKDNLIKELVKDAPLAAYTATLTSQQALAWAQAKDAAEDLVTPRDATGGETVAQHRERIEQAREAVAEPDITEAMIDLGLGSVIESVCPYKALEKQKRYMRRFMRKPADMLTRNYVNHIIRINNEEIPCLPPFLRDQGLSDDEIVDIVLYGVPKSWTNKMDEHDFDPLAHSLEELISFCERLESAEQLERGPTEQKQSSNGKKSSSKKFKSLRNNPDSGSGKWCHYHETDTHNTAECETLKRLKSQQKSGNSSSGPSKNKTWKRKADDAKSYSKKELSAIGKKAAKEAIKKAKAECNAVAKRKTEEDEMSISSSSSESVNSANYMDKVRKLDKELAEFEFTERGVAAASKSASC